MDVKPIQDEYSKTESVSGIIQQIRYCHEIIIFFRKGCWVRNNNNFIKYEMIDINNYFLDYCTKANTYILYRLSKR